MDLKALQVENATAIFVEAAKNMSDKLLVKGALRYEDLESDSSVDPKISFRYQASMLLRGSLSTSFREPSLSQLYSGQVSLQGIQDYSQTVQQKVELPLLELLKQTIQILLRKNLRI